MDLQHQTANFVNASWSMVRLRDLIYDMLSLLFTELSANGGMAGDGEAGRAFATVYKEAVNTVFDKAGFAHQVMANGAGALLKSAEEFLKTESKVAAELLEMSPPGPGIGSQPSGPDCTPRASHNAEDLPEVVGETSGTDQYLFNERFLGQPHKLRRCQDLAQRGQDSRGRVLGLGRRVEDRQPQSGRRDRRCGRGLLQAVRWQDPAAWRGGRGRDPYVEPTQRLQNARQRL